LNIFISAKKRRNVNLFCGVDLWRVEAGGAPPPLCARRTDNWFIDMLPAQIPFEIKKLVKRLRGHARRLLCDACDWETRWLTLVANVQQLLRSVGCVAYPDD
jgi:hypothetical protein